MPQLNHDGWSRDNSCDPNRCFSVAPLTALVERCEVTSQTCRHELNSSSFTDRIRPKISRRTNFNKR